MLLFRSPFSHFILLFFFPSQLHFHLHKYLPILAYQTLTLLLPPSTILLLLLLNHNNHYIPIQLPQQHPHPLLLPHLDAQPDHITLLHISTIIFVHLSSSYLLPKPWFFSLAGFSWSNCSFFIFVHENTLPLSKAFPLSSTLSFHKLSPSYYSFAYAISSSIEPNSYGEAIKNPNWCKAMQSEISALRLNNTWTLVELPPGKHAIGLKWVLKLKHHSDGSIEH